MITLQIHAKSESRQCGPLFIMFSDPSRMFQWSEKYDSDFTNTLSGFRAGRRVEMSERPCEMVMCESCVSV